MVPLLNILGAIALIVGLILWAAMLNTGLTNIRSMRPAEPDKPKPVPPAKPEPPPPTASRPDRPSR